jgi:hypothetical protein
MGCPRSRKKFQGFSEESAILLPARILISLLFEMVVNLKWVMVIMLNFG